MTAAVVQRGLFDRRRVVIGYGLGLAAMVVWVMSIYPSVETELVDYVEAMPESLRSLFGIEDITSLAGFVHAEIFSLVGPLVFLAVAITTGAGTIAGEEHERILPLVLATGVGRRDLLLSKLAASAVLLTALGVVTFASLVLGSAVAGGGIGVGAAVAACLQLTALGLVFGTLALTAGAATGNKAVASGTAVAVALVMYLIDALAGVVEWLEAVQQVSPFHWYAPGNPLVDGLAVGGLMLLVATTVVLTIVGVLAFERRDVGV